MGTARTARRCGQGSAAMPAAAATRTCVLGDFCRIAGALDLSITRLAAAIEAAERTPDHAC